MQQQINLYQSGFRRTTQIFCATSLIRAGGIIMFAMLLTYGFAVHKLSNVDTELQIVGDQDAAFVQHLQKLQATIADLEIKMSGAERLDDAMRLLDEKKLILALVQSSTLGDSEGFSRYLTSLARQDTDGLLLTQINLSAFGDRTRLEGQALRADLVPAYLQGLAGEPPFAHQKFHHFQIIGAADPASGIVSFSLNSEAHAGDKQVRRQ